MELVFVLGGWAGQRKGTHCSKIVYTFGFVHLSAGDLLREERNSGSDHAEMINTYIKEGRIVPAEVTVNLLKKAMAASGKHKFLVDGFPRNLSNLETWVGILGQETRVLFTLFFDCPEKTLEERLLQRGQTSGRNDDNIETIKKRYVRGLLRVLLREEGLPPDSTPALALRALHPSLTQLLLDPGLQVPNFPGGLDAGRRATERAGEGQADLLGPTCRPSLRRGHQIVRGESWG